MRIEKKLFEREAILAALALTESRSCAALRDDGDAVEIEFSAASGDLPAIESDFMKELINQQVRRDLNVQFGNLRELIVRQAFSPITAQ